jgi:cation:H+ antiporter
MVSTYILFVLGLALLIGGAELLVRGASRLAALAGIAPLVIGLTVVAFGTSAPELAVSVRSALLSSADIALGNVVGSNIFNILFILGLSAIAVPLSVSRQLIRIDVPIMIGVSILLLFMAYDGSISRVDGFLLFLGILAYTVFTIRQGKKAGCGEQDDASGSSRQGMIASMIFVAAGLGMLVIGSRWLVNGAAAMAASFGVSELVIGLTIVATGTSLPEAATSVMAGVKGERDIAVGNVVGSNIFNILSVLGFSALAGPDGIQVSSAALRFDLPVMIAVAAVCLPIFFTGFRISRWEGALFIGYYALYIAYVVLAAAHNKSLPFLTNVVLLFVLPLTAIMILIPLYLQTRKKEASHGS